MSLFGVLGMDEDDEVGEVDGSRLPCKLWRGCLVEAFTMEALLG